MVGKSLTVITLIRHSGGWQPPVHAGGFGNEKNQVSHLEETALLQTTGGLHDNLVQVKKGWQHPLHMYEHKVYLSD